MSVKQRRFNLKYLSVSILAGLAVVLSACHDPEMEARSNEMPGQPAPAFTLPDTNGNQISLSDYRGQFVVLEWVNYDCPYVRKHYDSGNMQALQRKFTEAGVTWLSINSSAPGKQGNFTPEQVNDLIQSKDAAPSAYLMDPAGEVGRNYGAKATPHMFVINPEGVIIYQGAIDDKPTTDTDDIAGARNYVDEALTLAMQGQPVEVSGTSAYGCSVKYD
ncbi:MAG: thioredoxin family protein [Leptospiraceae bacterium]|nr:thioredoxin family protein [Leptospiraceae bacterium]